VRTRLVSGVAAVLVLCAAPAAQALPGTHAPAISTYDTRASSVVLAYRHGSGSGGPFNTFSYNANFTSTTGKLSAQFGIHYVNYAPSEGDSTAHGVGASGVGLFVFPVAGRYDDGVPKAALSFDVGVVPTAYISGQRNFLTLPLVLGFGVPLSPARQLTFTPWIEVAPSVNLDTVFRSADIKPDPNSVTIDPKTGTVSLSQSAIEAAVKKGVTVDAGVSVPMRVGLETAIHLGESADFNIYTSLHTLGGGFSGSSVFTLGAGLVFRWDDIVPAVLPVERRLDREGCDAIEGRFRTCPNSRQWLSPEQKSRLAPSDSAPATAPIPPAVGAPSAPAVPPSPAVPAAPAAKPAPAPTPAPTAPATAPAPAAPPSAAFPG